MAIKLTLAPVVINTMLTQYWVLDADKQNMQTYHLIESLY
jgi:hypothetical protein